MTLSNHSLDDAIVRYVAVAHAAWPELAVDPELFSAYALERVGALGKLPEAYAGDLLLAWGCTRRLVPALSTFDRLFRPVIIRVLVRRGAASDVADEAQQRVLERLLVAPPDAHPKIAEYKGQGPLKSWVSTTAATTLLMMQRSGARRREAPIDEDVLSLVGLDPELASIAQRSRAEVHDAIVHALGCLTDRERVLLRLQLAEGVNIDQLGTMYSVNRATAARWLAAARAAVLKHTRAALRQRLNLSDSEIDSMLQLVQSRLDVSILRHLSE